LSDQAAFSNKFIRPQESYHSFLSVLRQNGDLDLALLDIEDGIGIAALRKKDLPFRIFGNVPARRGSRQKPYRIECRKSGRLATVAPLAWTYCWTPRHYCLLETPKTYETNVGTGVAVRD
jgi:hypothetical protein